MQLMYPVDIILDNLALRVRKLYFLKIRSGFCTFPHGSYRWWVWQREIIRDCEWDICAIGWKYEHLPIAIAVSLSLCKLAAVCTNQSLVTSFGGSTTLQLESADSISWRSVALGSEGWKKLEFCGGVGSSSPVYSKEGREDAILDDLCAQPLIIGMGLSPEKFAVV